MRKLLQSILCICLCPLLPAQEVAPQNAPRPADVPVDARAPSSDQTADSMSRSVNLPRDMHVTLRLEQSVSSATARKGEQIRFTLANDLVADGQVVATAGSSCYAQIAQVRPRDAKNSGLLKFSDPRLDLGAHRQIQFRRNPGTTPDEVEETVGFVAVALMMLPIVLPLAPFIAMHNKRKAKNKPQTTETEFTQGTNFDYFVRRTTIVREDSTSSPQQIRAASER